MNKLPILYTIAKMLREKIEKLENITEDIISEIKCNECWNQYDSDNCIGCTKENNFRNFKKNGGIK